MDFGIYQHLVDFAGAGASVPLTGFGNLLAKGAIEGVTEKGLLGAFTGGLKAAAGRHSSRNLLRLHRFPSCKAQD